MATRCEVCGGGRECRFEAGCSCWLGMSCKVTTRKGRTYSTIPSLHGGHCFDQDGDLVCGWPEYHPALVHA
jgi:hypothetical protein